MLIVQLVVVAVDVLAAETAPPKNAIFDVIVQSVTLTVDSPRALIAPPQYSAEFESSTQDPTAAASSFDDFGDFDTAGSGPPATPAVTASGGEAAVRNGFDDDFGVNSSVSSAPATVASAGLSAGGDDSFDSGNFGSSPATAVVGGSNEADDYGKLAGTISISTDSGDASSKSVAVPLRSVNIFCLSFGITSGVNTSSVEPTTVFVASAVSSGCSIFCRSESQPSTPLVS